MWDKRCQINVDRIHDGDTIYDVYVDDGKRRYSYEDARLLGVYAPELSQTGGQECRQFVVNWVKEIIASYGSPPPTWPFIVITARMKVADKEQMTLSRYVDTITNLDGTRNLNFEIAEFIRQKGYSGGIGSV